MRTLSPLKKGQILAAARELLVSRGFENISLEEVAEAAGVAKGTLFLYFRGKEELIRAVFAELVDELGRALDALQASGRAGEDLLSETIRTVLGHFERNRDFLSRFGAGSFPACGGRSATALLSKFGDNLERMTKILRRVSNDGLLPARDLGFSAAALFGLCRSALIHRVLTGDRRPLEARTAQVARLFLHGARGPA